MSYKLTNDGSNFDDMQMIAVLFITITNLNKQKLLVLHRRYHRSRYVASLLTFISYCCCYKKMKKKHRTNYTSYTLSNWHKTHHHFRWCCWLRSWRRTTTTAVKKTVAHLIPNSSTPSDSTPCPLINAPVRYCYYGSCQCQCRCRRWYFAFSATHSTQNTQQ